MAFALVGLKRAKTSFFETTMQHIPHILQITALPIWLEREIAQWALVSALPAQADERADFLAQRGGDFVAAVTTSATGADAALMAALPHLRGIASFGVGLDRIDLDAARAHGIAVGHTPDVLNDCVADLALGLLLDVARRISAGDRWVRTGGWRDGQIGQPAFGLGFRVSGARLGVVGLGRIGRGIAERASAGFGMLVRYHNRRAVAGVPWDYEGDLAALAAWADFLVVATPGGAQTQHLIDAKILQALGNKGFFINIARGSVVDEAALITALQNGTIAGAGLDVFAHEPHVPQALRTLDNVVLTPHIASATAQTRQAMAECTLDNLRAIVQNQPLPHPAWV